jgi:hypothetical protein
VCERRASMECTRLPVPEGDGVARLDGAVECAGCRVRESQRRSRERSDRQRRDRERGAIASGEIAREELGVGIWEWRDRESGEIAPLREVRTQGLRIRI